MSHILFYCLILSRLHSIICTCNIVTLWSSTSRQEKEAWIKSKYVEKRFLKKMSGSEALVEGERKSRPWTVKKCQRHNSYIRAPNKARRKYHRYEPGSASPANLSAGQYRDFSVVINVSMWLIKQMAAGYTVYLYLYCTNTFWNPDWNILSYGSSCCKVSSGLPVLSRWAGFTLLLLWHWLWASQ